ncbi:MAG: hypothetical protein FWC17_00285 [Treponema sp.]|nr:hypothetical protein [Treponema sp.]
MNKCINFEDTIYILNVRIRLIRDLLRLDTDVNLFYSQTLADLEFISNALDSLTIKFLENLKFLDREVEAENILDAEWQFSQLMNEITSNSSPFSKTQFPQMAAFISKMQKDSAKRKNQIEDSYVPADTAKQEPVVSNAELNGLLGGALIF